MWCRTALGPRVSVPLPCSRAPEKEREIFAYRKARGKNCLLIAPCHPQNISAFPRKRLIITVVAGNGRLAAQLANAHMHFVTFFVDSRLIIDGLVQLPLLMKSDEKVLFFFD